MDLVLTSEGPISELGRGGAAVTMARVKPMDTKPKQLSNASVYMGTAQNYVMMIRHVLIDSIERLF